MFANEKENVMALVEFNGVNKYYGDYHALRDINLSLEAG